MDPLERLFREAQFLLSAPKLAQCPPDEGMEVAFAGRSNAGKSTAINRITGRRALARTSKTPGRTRLLNFFQLDEQRRLVDLPGYGYAKVDKATKQQWQQDMEEYLAGRQCLRGLVLMMDIRHPLKDFDLMLLDWAAAAEMPVHILLTKADKLKRGPGLNTARQVERALSSHPAPLSLQLFSGTAGTGVEQARDLLARWLEIEGGPENRP